MRCLRCSAQREGLAGRFVNKRWFCDRCADFSFGELVAPAPPLAFVPELRRRYTDAEMDWAQSMWPQNNADSLLVGLYHYDGQADRRNICWMIEPLRSRLLVGIDQLFEGDVSPRHHLTGAIP